MEGNKRRTALFALGALAATAVGIFCVANFARANESIYTGLAITEIMYDPAGSNADHAKWIELTNLSPEKIILSPTGSETTSGWKIKDLKITDSSNHYFYVKENNPLEVYPGDFLIISDSLTNFANDYPELKNVPILKSAVTLTNSGGLYNLTLFDNSAPLDAITYAKDWGASDNGKSLEKIDLLGDNQKENWQESCEKSGTPGENPLNKVCPLEPTPENIPAGNNEMDTGNTSQEAGTTSFRKVYLNEIYPNTKNDAKEEYIEIRNEEDAPVDLYDWTIRDASKTGKYTFEEHAVIDPGKYLAIRRPQSKIALNNSTESVYLYNPQGEITSSVSYETSQKNSSYNFDGIIWRWSKYLTPGEKNKFDSEPEVKISKVKNAYKNFYTEFSANAKDKETKKLKYAWDFGDGKKSYLKNTSHKYLDTGKYTVTLSVTDDSQTIEKSFVLTVKNYPRTDLEIVKILPNPIGNDSEGETIDLKNNSGKKIDLTGWKIATGTPDKMYNHPISEGVFLESNETKTITRKISKFSLNNKAGKIQLVSPDGKITDAIEYAKEKIAEGEAYAKMDDEWFWTSADAQEENIAMDAEADTAGDSGDTTDVKNEIDSGEVLGATDISTAQYKSSFTSEDAFIFLSQINFLKTEEREMSYRPARNPASSLAYLLASLI